MLKRMWVLLTFSLTFLQVIPASADRDRAKADLIACSSLNRSSQKLQEAGVVMEAWVRGGDNLETQAKLNAILDVLTREEGKFANLTLPGHSQELHRGAQSCAEHRRKALREAQSLTQRKKLSTSILRDYCRVTLESTRLSQKEWFRVRLSFIKKNLSREKSRPLAEYYAWQTTMLAKWLEEADLSADAQVLLTSSYNTNSERLALAETSEKLMHKAMQLHASTQLLPAAPGLQECQKRAVEEQLALVRLCEAIIYLYRDPSPDSDSRLRHYLRTLAKASTELEGAALIALQKALAAPPKL